MMSYEGLTFTSSATASPGPSVLQLTSAGCF